MLQDFGSQGAMLLGITLLARNSEVSQMTIPNSSKEASVSFSMNYWRDLPDHSCNQYLLKQAVRLASMPTLLRGLHSKEQMKGHK